MVGFLLGFEGRKTFTWYALTPNTVVAILATVSRLSNGIVLSSALGQFKWIHHHQRAAPLADFLLATGASHGPWDSLCLIIRTRSMAGMAIGCWAIILMLPFDAFAQQIVRFESTMLFRTDHNSLVPRATEWDGGSYSSVAVAQVNESGLRTPYGEFGDMILDFGMQAAILSGLNTNRDQVLQQVPVSCQSSECRWNSYESLATCSVCNDISDRLQERHFVAFPMSLYAPNRGRGANASLTEWFLPNGLAINNADTELDVLGPDSGSPATVLTTQTVFNAAHTITLRNLTTLLMSLSSLNAPPPDSSAGYRNWPARPIRALECGLYLCVKQFNTSIINGTTYQDERAVAADRVPDSWQWTANMTELWGWAEQTELFNNTFHWSRSDLQIAGPAEAVSQTPLKTANVTQGAIDSLIWRLNQTFRTNLENLQGEQFLSMTGIVTSNPGRGYSGSNTPYFYDPPSMEAIWSSDDVQQTQIITRFEALATSMTNSMRTAGNDTVTGEQGDLIQVLTVQWWWLSLPIICVLLGTVFLFIAMVETRRTRTPLWKADAAAFMFHAFETVPSSNVWDTSRLTGMEKFSEETVVRLADTHGKGYFLEPVTMEMPSPMSPAKPPIITANQQIPRKPVPVRYPSSVGTSQSTAVESRDLSEQSFLMARSEAL